MDSYKDVIVRPKITNILTFLQLYRDSDIKTRVDIQSKIVNEKNFNCSDMTKTLIFLFLFLRRTSSSAVTTW